MQLLLGVLNLWLLLDMEPESDSPDLIYKSFLRAQQLGRPKRGDLCSGEIPLIDVGFPGRCGLQWSDRCGLPLIDVGSNGLAPLGQPPPPPPL